MNPTEHVALFMLILIAIVMILFLNLFAAHAAAWAWNKMVLPFLDGSLGLASLWQAWISIWILAFALSMTIIISKLNKLIQLLNEQREGFKIRSEVTFQVMDNTKN